MLSYVTGDATSPSGDGPRIICHVCNDLGGWGRGFVLALSRRWPEPEAAYRSMRSYELGETQLVQVEPTIWVANMIAQHGVRPTQAGPPIRYEALNNCLAALATRAADLGASVHMPRIGCGLAGGTWDQVEPLITDNLVRQGIEVTVYDLVTDSQ
ncbi:macro domain-containing protein [Nonomuraea sp. NBC_01738]|uniref:macro domain-containing protein n=1 Tax=Nonomuraea sp. NBC_01738 TaxID=2976003 RepID=UPI002E0F3A64|nr:macro domain-containing protein [Nonomuraea sp. NBC_01738]